METKEQNAHLGLDAKLWVLSDDGAWHELRHLHDVTVSTEHIEFDMFSAEKDMSLLRKKVATFFAIFPKQDAPTIFAIKGEYCRNGGCFVQNLEEVQMATLRYQRLKDMSPFANRCISPPDGLDKDRLFYI